MDDEAFSWALVPVWLFLIILIGLCLAGTGYAENSKIALVLGTVVLCVGIRNTAHYLRIRSKGTTIPVAPRFSLRTLLIVMTLVAVLLGAVVYTGK